MKQIRDRRTKIRLAWIKAAAFILLAVALFLFLRAKKEMLIQEFTKFISVTLSQQTELAVEIGKVDGNILGSIELSDVTVRVPWLPADQSMLFEVEEIQFRYRLLDFLSKKFDSRVTIYAKNPKFYWRPHLSLRKPQFPFFKWLEHFTLSREKHLEMRIENLSLFIGYDRKEISGIDLFYDGRDLKLELPFSHLVVGDADISTVFKFEGHLESSTISGDEALKGQIVTEGTVINWKPLAQESRFEFTFSPDSFRLISSNFLGGISLEGSIDFANDYEIDFKINTLNYPLENLSSFAAFGASTRARMDLDIHFYGSPWFPNLESNARIYDGWIGKRTFKAMDVHVEGIYPTVHLRDSRILLEDGSAMHIADKTLEVKELFRFKTYQSLISETNQEMVVWGDWELSRSVDSNNQPEFLMERLLGENTRVHLKKTRVEDEASMGAPDIKQQDSRQVEVGFEYRLKSKDSLKLEFREDEEFVGVERKLKF